MSIEGDHVARAVTGLPWSTWLLLIAAIGPGLALVFRFFAIHRDRSPEGGGADTEEGGGRG